MLLLSESMTNDRGTVAEFLQLADWWKRDMEYQSSPARIAMHPGYQRVIEMGRAALPFILYDLRATHAPWFWALRAITGEDAVPDEDRGSTDDMVRAWVRWGIENNFISD